MKRRGFTLVELLIVIAIIGTLTALMTLSSTNATASAEAAKVVAALRTAKTATTMYYWDHPDMKDQKKSDWKTKITDIFADEIADYLEATPDGGTGATTYTLELVDPADATNDTLASAADWYVGYTLSNNAKVTDVVKKRLAGQADSYGLFTISEGAASPFTKDDTAIYMKVRTGVTASTTTPSDPPTQEP